MMFTGPNDSIQISKNQQTCMMIYLKMAVIGYGSGSKVPAKF